MKPETELPFPQLREDIALYPGATSTDGSPTWTLHDPPSNRFYRMGWFEFEVLSRWDLKDPTAIATAITTETTLTPQPFEVETFITYLTRNHLLQPTTNHDRKRFLRQRQKNRSWWQWLLQNYLFIRMPLWHPDPFLKRTLPYIRWLFTGGFATFIGLVALFGLVLLMRQWESFTTTFLHFFTFTGMLYYGGALIVSKTLHELGHAYTAHRYGCRVPTMGIMFLVFWPVLYTETSEAWKLTARRQRLAIGMAGILAELGLAAVATLVWSFLPEGPMKSATFLLASTLWVLSLGINLNPLMRFDGYFLLSDITGIANLQSRSFSYARWWLREQLFGFAIAPPEPASKGRQWFLIFFAISTGIYRLFLFLGIALLVYHFFFKLLGLFLFAVEIIWFIARPIGEEVMAWYQHRKAFHKNRALLRTSLLSLLLLTGLALPWPYASTTVPALLQAQHHTTLYTPTAARIDRIHVRAGQHVHEGDLLFLLEAPDLQYRRQTIEHNIALMRWQLSVQEMRSNPLESDRVLQQTLDTLRAQHKTVLTDLEKLRITAPFSGTVVDLAEDITSGDWVAKEKSLLTLMDENHPMVESYIAEADLGVVSDNAIGTFYPEDPDARPLTGHLQRIDQTTTRYLSEPYLASVHGGPLPVRMDQAGKLVVEGSYYRSDLSLDQARPLHQISRGYLSIKTTPESLLKQFWRMVHAIFIRESGF